MKICKDCRWAYHWNVSGTTVAWLCRHASAVTSSTDFVTGETRQSPRPCDMHRNYGECGPQGKLWEAKDDAAPPSGGFV